MKQTAWKFSTRNFDVRLEILPEDMPLGAWIDDPEDLHELEDKIESGRLMWFQARAVVRWRGRDIGEASIGACCYESANDFMTGGYFRDLIAEAVNEARATILCAHSVNLRAAH